MDSTHFQKVLSSYQHIGNLAYSAAQSAAADDSFSFLEWFLVQMPIVPVLLAFHSLFAAVKIYELTGGKQYWLKSLVLTTFAAFGGSTLSAMLSGAPAPLFTVSSNYMVPYITVAWYVVNHITPLRYLLQTRPLSAALAFGATAAKARSIMAFIDTFTGRFPDAAVGAVLLGGLAGSGGSLFVSVEKVVKGRLRTRSELSAPGWGFKSAYVAAAAYYVGTDPAGWVRRHIGWQAAGRFERDEMRLIISLALCAHAALETMYGRHVNPLFLFEEVAFALTGVKKTAEGDDDGAEERRETDGSWVETEEESAEEVAVRDGVKVDGAVPVAGLRRRKNRA